jgi:hypothetical protein
MEQEKRRGEAPIPSDLQNALSVDQLMTLRQIENFGWQLAFVRRPLFQESVIVVATSDNKNIGVLEETGELNLQAEIKIRQRTT